METKHPGETWWSLEVVVSVYEPRQRRRFQAMWSAILRVRLERTIWESPDNFERPVGAHEDQSGRRIPQYFLAATVIAGMDTIAVHFALNDSSLDTYETVVETVRSHIRTSTGWNMLLARRRPSRDRPQAKGEAREAILDRCKAVKGSRSEERKKQATTM